MKDIFVSNKILKKIKRIIIYVINIHLVLISFLFFKKCILFLLII